MPYSSSAARGVPSVRESARTEFSRADGQVETHAHYQKVMAAAPNGDVDTQTTACKTELACGCISEKEIGGICSECAKTHVTAIVCKEHFVVCECGEPCCWKHSRLSEKPPVSLCQRCHIRQQNKAMFRGLASAVRSVVSKILFRPNPPGNQGP